MDNIIIPTLILLIAVVLYEKIFQLFCQKKQISAFLTTLFAPPIISIIINYFFYYKHTSNVLVKPWVLIQFAIGDFSVFWYLISLATFISAVIFCYFKEKIEKQEKRNNK